MVVRLVQLTQILIVRLQRHRFGIVPPRVDAAKQYFGWRLQVQDQIGLGRVAREKIVETLIDEQLVVVEIQVGEDLVFVEEVIRNRRLREQVRLPQRRLLPVTRQQIKELRLQRRAGTVGVEVGEKRIVGFLADDVRVESPAEPLGESGFPCADRPFDRNVAEVQAGPMISSRGEDRTARAAPAEAATRSFF